MNMFRALRLELPASSVEAATGESLYRSQFGILTSVFPVKSTEPIAVLPVVSRAMTHMLPGELSATALAVAVGAGDTKRPVNINDCGWGNRTSSAQPLVVGLPWLGGWFTATPTLPWPSPKPLLSVIAFAPFV